MFSHEKLLAEADRLGMSKTVTRVAINLYRVQRVMQDRWVVGKATYARRSVSAGCRFATTVVQIYCARAFLEWSERHPCSRLTHTSAM